MGGGGGGERAAGADEDERQEELLNHGDPEIGVEKRPHERGEDGSEDDARSGPETAHRDAAVEFFDERDHGDDDERVERGHSRRVMDGLRDLEDEECGEHNPRAGRNPNARRDAPVFAREDGGVKCVGDGNEQHFPKTAVDEPVLQPVGVGAIGELDEGIRERAANEVEKKQAQISDAAVRSFGFEGDIW